MKEPSWGIVEMRVDLSFFLSGQICFLIRGSIRRTRSGASAPGELRHLSVGLTVTHCTDLACMLQAALPTSFWKESWEPREGMETCLPSLSSHSSTPIPLRHRVFLYSLSWHWIRFVVQDDLKLMSLLSQLSKYSDYRLVPPHTVSPVLILA